MQRRLQFGMREDPAEFCGYRGGQGSGICFSGYLSTFAATPCAVHPGVPTLLREKGISSLVLAEVERLAKKWGYSKV